MKRILVVCTANQCRSPVGAGELARHAIQRSIDVTIDSAGFMEGGFEPPSEIVHAGRAFGLDLSNHRSRQLDANLVNSADLIVTMTRRHVRELAVTYPGTWQRTFTIRELVRRGQSIGPLAAQLTPDAWIAGLHEGRQPSDLLGTDETDDVQDPMGGIQNDYDVMAETLWGLTHEMADLIWPVTANSHADAGTNSLEQG